MPTAITVCFEGMLGLQLCPNILVVVYLSVNGQDHGIIFVVERLRPVFQINDREPFVTKNDAFVPYLKREGNFFLVFFFC